MSVDCVQGSVGFRLLGTDSRGQGTSRRVAPIPGFLRTPGFHSTRFLVCASRRSKLGGVGDPGGKGVGVRPKEGGGALGPEGPPTDGRSWVAVRRKGGAPVQDSPGAAFPAGSSPPSNPGLCPDASCVPGRLRRGVRHRLPAGLRLLGTRPAAPTRRTRRSTIGVREGQPPGAQTPTPGKRRTSLSTGGHPPHGP